jgi:hypothetical protein
MLQQAAREIATAMRKMDEEGEPVSWISSAGLEDQNSFCKEQHHGPRFFVRETALQPV